MVRALLGRRGGGDGDGPLGGLPPRFGRHRLGRAERAGRWRGARGLGRRAVPREARPVLAAALARARAGGPGAHPGGRRAARVLSREPDGARRVDDVRASVRARCLPSGPPAPLPLGGCIPLAAASLLHEARWPLDPAALLAAGLAGACLLGPRAERFVHAGRGFAAALFLGALLAATNREVTLGWPTAAGLAAGALLVLALSFPARLASPPALALGAGLLVVTALAWRAPGMIAALGLPFVALRRREVALLGVSAALLALFVALHVAREPSIPALPAALASGAVLVGAWSWRMRPEGLTRRRAG